MAIITISGQVGSGAQDIGRALADILSADYVDRELLAEAARRTGTTAETLEERETASPSLTQRVTGILQRALDNWALGYAAAPGDEPPFNLASMLTGNNERLSQISATQAEQINDERLGEAISSVIKDLAAMPNVIIMGRGGQYVLKDNPHVLRVLVLAPLERRIAHYQEQRAVSADDAEREVNSQERFRQAFLHKYFHVAPLEPLDYDIVVNSERWAWQDYARMLAEAARARDFESG